MAGPPVTFVLRTSPLAGGGGSPRRALPPYPRLKKFQFTPCLQPSHFLRVHTGQRGKARFPGQELGSPGWTPGGKAPQEESVPSSNPSPLASASAPSPARELPTL